MNKEEDILIKEATREVVNYLLPYIHNSSEASLKIINYFIRNGKTPKDFASGNKPGFIGVYLNDISLGEKAIIDLFKFIKLLKQMKLKKKTKVVEAKKEVKKAQSGDTLQVRYDYPQIGGKPMEPELKKRYRAIMRKYLRKDALTMDQAQKKAAKEILQFILQSENKVNKAPKKKEEKKEKVSKVKETKEAPKKKETKVSEKKKLIKKKIREDED